MAPNSITMHKPVSIVLCQVFFVGSWMELVFLVLQSKLQGGKGLYLCGVAVFVVTHSEPL